MTQIAADTANTVVVWTAESPSCRDSGGRMLNSTVWPAPMHRRLTNRMPNARRRSARVVTWTADGRSLNESVPLPGMRGPNPS